MLSPAAYFGHLTLTRLVLQRGIAAVYLVAFISVRNQGRALLGSAGLLPIPQFVRHMRFRQSPSLFHWRYSDTLLSVVAWAGITLSAAALCGLTELGPVWLSVSAWLTLYGLYLSVVNVGQSFFGFGWESMLLEAGFFAAFLGPRTVEAPVVPVLILRWMFIRTELGAGLIKLRHDRCWRDLTCLDYHYETQPLPNPLSWYFHRLPRPAHRFGVLFSHFLQLVCPFGLLAPQPVAGIAATLCIAQQLWLIVSGNYSWLNWLTVVLGFAGFSDAMLRPLLPYVHPYAGHPAPVAFSVVLWAVGLAAIALSIQPTLNLFSRNQKMNYSNNRWHLVNTYGAFGSVTKERHEIVLEGTADHVSTPASVWLEYGLKGKPGDLKRMPPQVAPYHLRLDWMLWFLPFTVAVTPQGVQARGYDVWFVRLLRKLLRNEAATLRLLRVNPFRDAPPGMMRARFYRYRYTDAETRRRTGAWWTRELLGEYVPPVSLASLPDA